MKWFIASDLHGSAQYGKLVLDAYDREKADRLLLLGDILNPGPRNGIPEGYVPMALADMLNERKDDILAVRGNCDSEIDQMLLSFPMTADYTVISLDKRIIFATHGHIFHRDHLPPMHEGDILLHGHTHRSACEQAGQYFYCNPGSPTFPFDGHRGYLTLDQDRISLKTLDGIIVREITLES